MGLEEEGWTLKRNVAFPSRGDWKLERSKAYWERRGYETKIVVVREAVGWSWRREPGRHDADARGIKTTHLFPEIRALYVRKVP